MKRHEFAVRTHGGDGSQRQQQRGIRDGPADAGTVESADQTGGHRGAQCPRGGGGRAARKHLRGHTGSRDPIGNLIAGSDRAQKVI